MSDLRELTQLISGGSNDIHYNQSPKGQSGIIHCTQQPTSNMTGQAWSREISAVTCRKCLEWEPTPPDAA